MSFRKHHKENIAKKAVLHLTTKLDKLEKQKKELATSIGMEHLKEFWEKTADLPQKWFKKRTYEFNMKFSNEKGGVLYIQIEPDFKKKDHVRLPYNYDETISHIDQSRKVKSMVARYFKLHSECDKLDTEKKSLYNTVYDRISGYRSVKTLQKDWPEISKFVDPVDLTGKQILHVESFTKLNAELRKSGLKL